MAYSSKAGAAMPKLLARNVVPLLFMLPTTASGAVDDKAQLLNISARLTHEAVGRGTFEDLLEIANIAVQQGADVALAQMTARECRLFRSFHGEVADTKDCAVCVVGLGNM